MAKKTVDEAIAEINRQIDFLHRTRSVFPRLRENHIGQRAFEAPSYYRQQGHAVSVELPEPMTADFINGLNSLAHWLNENFVLRLFAVVDSGGEPSLPWRLGSTFGPPTADRTGPQTLGRPGGRKGSRSTTARPALAP